MAKQAAPFRAARPDIKAPVMHYSLSLQAGDGRKSPAEWKPMVEAFLRKMDFPLDGAWTSVVHNDTDHQHCHIAFLRSLGNGQVWNREFSAKRAIQACAELEKEFDLLVHDRTPKREKKHQSINEKKLKEQLKTEGKTMSKEIVKRAIDDFVAAHHGQQFSPDEMRAGLAQAGVNVEFVERDGGLAGVKFQHEGIFISGSSLGDDYKAQGLLARGLTPVVAQPAPAQPVAVAQVAQPTETTPAASQPGASQRARPMAAHASAMEALSQLLHVLAVLSGLKFLAQLIARLVNLLLGRKEAQHGAPAGSLGRIDENTMQARPGIVPSAGQHGHAQALAAMAAAAGGLKAISEKVQGGKWSELLEHGAAPYKHQDGQKPSYFARLRGPDGKDTEVWGIDIGRALAEAGVNVGDQVALERAGKQAVTVTERQADGKVVEKAAHRNAWQAVKAPAAPAPAGPAPQTQAMRDSTIRYLRERADYLASAGDSAGRQEVMDELKRLAFSADDEVRYQDWLATPAGATLEGETGDERILRREAEWLQDRLAHVAQQPGGEREAKEIGQRLSELQDELAQQRHQHDERQRG